MSRHLLLTCVVCVVLLSVFLLTGCTAIGLAVGGHSDRAADRRRAARYETANRDRLSELSLGTPVTLVLDDSTRVSGRYWGGRSAPDSTYEKRYGVWRNSFPDSLRPPALGEEITLHLHERLRTGIFRGFNYGHLLLEAGGDTIAVTLDDIVQLTDIASRPSPLKVFSEEVVAGRFPAVPRNPSFAQFEIRAAGVSRMVEFDRVAYVAYSESDTGKHHRGRVMGFLLGFTVDLAVAAVVLISAYVAAG